MQGVFDCSVTSKTNCQICATCWKDLNNKKQVIPHNCTANKMWIGDVPDELQDLTLPEQHLIALYRHNQCVLKFESVYHSIETQQSKLKGNCISVINYFNLTFLLNNYCFYVYYSFPKICQILQQRYH